MTQDSADEELVAIIANKIGWFIGHTDDDCMDTAQTIFEAVAPMMIAQGMREAATMMLMDHPGETPYMAVIRRAKELDPK